MRFREPKGSAGRVPGPLLALTWESFRALSNRDTLQQLGEPLDEDGPAAAQTQG